jgi:predicted acylesterase/phospholipase RssA
MTGPGRVAAIDVAAPRAAPAPEALLESPNRARGVTGTERGHQGENPPTLHVSFSGGEARGYAHVGALYAIERLGLRIAEVSGTSIGALVAALVAAGFSAADVARVGCTLRRRDVFRLAWPDLRSLMRIGRPDLARGPGLWTLAPYERTVDALLRGARFSDLAVPCAIQATDLRDARPVHFRRETHPDLPVARAVAAAAALPGLMRPVAWAGRLFADGGAYVRLRAVPIQAERIVVSDVSSHGDASPPLDSVPRLLGAYLRARERPTAPPRHVGGRPVTVLRYAETVAALRSFRRAPPAVVRRVIAEATASALQRLEPLGSSWRSHA